MLLLAFALAEPLLEDALEVGSVPVYGSERYPTPPVAPVQGHEPAPAAPAVRAVAPVAEPAPRVEAVVEAVPVDDDPLPHVLLDDDVWDVDIPEVADADPGRESALAAQDGPSAAPEPVAVVESEEEPPAALRSVQPGPTDYIAFNEGTYEQGFARGQREATARAKGPFLGGTLAGAIIPVCGCLGASTVAALVPTEVGPGDYQRGSKAYEDGYIAGYKSSARKQRIGYAFLGGAVGTSIGIFFYSSF